MSKIITGRFADFLRGPASYGSLTLVLKSEQKDDIDNVIPLVALTEEEKEEFRWFHRSYSFTLGANGEIPSGAEIFANDELTGDSSYDVIVSAGARASDYYYRQSLKITGPSPIDLNTIIPEGAEPEPEPEPEPRVAPPLPAKRTLGANYSGFYGGTIYPSGDGDSMTIAEGEEHYPFYLPFKAVIRQASIFVIVPCLGRSVFVGLHNAVTAERVCRIAIDASKHGVASAFLDESKTVSPGEYIMSWGVDSYSPTLKVRNINKTGLFGTAPIGPMVYFSAGE